MALVSLAHKGSFTLHALYFPEGLKSVLSCHGKRSTLGGKCMSSEGIGAWTGVTMPWGVSYRRLCQV